MAKEEVELIYKTPITIGPQSCVFEITEKDLTLIRDPKAGQFSRYKIIIKFSGEDVTLLHEEKEENAKSAYAEAMEDIRTGKKIIVVKESSGNKMDANLVLSTEVTKVRTRGSK